MVCVFGALPFLSGNRRVHALAVMTYRVQACHSTYCALPPTRPMKPTLILQAFDSAVRGLQIGDKTYLEVCCISFAHSLRCMMQLLRVLCVMLLPSWAT